MRPDQASCIKAAKLLRRLAAEAPGTTYRFGRHPVWATHMANFPKYPYGVMIGRMFAMKYSGRVRMFGMQSATACLACVLHSYEPIVDDSVEWPVWVHGGLHEVGEIFRPDLPAVWNAMVETPRLELRLLVSGVDNGAFWRRHQDRSGMETVATNTGEILNFKKFGVIASHMTMRKSEACGFDVFSEVAGDMIAAARRAGKNVRFTLAEPPARPRKYGSTVIWP